MANFKKKFNSKGEEVRRVLDIKDPKKFYEGTIYNTRLGDKLQIVDWDNSNHVKVRFLDGSNYETWTFKSCIDDGAVKNPYHILEYGGFYGEGPYTSTDNMKAYKTWSGMLKRANAYLDHESYFTDTVCDEWLNFQNFCPWYNEYVSRLNPEYLKDYQIDKDILQWNRRNKIYSPSTCCIIHKRVNSALVGMFLNKKEELPLGVREVYNRYTASVTFEEKRIHLGTYDTPEEAFNVYRLKKKEIINSVATDYYQKGTMLPEIYQAIINLDIIPYAKDLI